MRILILGGTRFIGRHIVEALRREGHGVSVLTRGQSPDELPGTVERLRGDRNAAPAGLTSLAGRSWDACVDVSGYTPLQVGASAAALQASVERYVFISTVSVYQPTADLPITETHPLLAAAADDVTEVTGQSYGPLKVTCERVVMEHFADRCTILRPQIVAGPYDPTGRHTYWVQRAMQGGEMIAPGDGTERVQVVDVRDIARFTERVVSLGIGGIFNMAGPLLTWRGFVETLGATDVVWASAALLQQHGVTPAEMPLFVAKDSEHAGIMNVSAERAVAAGFTTSTARRTVDDVRAWLREHPIAPGLSPERERDLLAAARATSR